MAQNGPSQGLAREAIGLREVLFQSITHMAPAAAVAFSIIVGANFASRRPAALGGAGPGRLPAGGGLHRAAGQAAAVGRRVRHLRRPRPAPGRRLPGRLGLCVRGAPGGAAAVPHLRQRGGQHPEPGVRLELRHLVGGVGGGRGRGRVRPRVVRGAAEHRRGHDPGAVRDPGVRRPGRHPDLPGRRRQHSGGVRHRVRRRRGLRRPVGGDRRLRLHHPGLHRLRGRRAAGRGGQGPAAHHPAGRPLLLPRDRPVLRADHLRGHRRLRPGPVRRVPPVGGRQPLGRPGPRGLGGRLGAGVPGHRQLGHRQRQRLGQRRHPDLVRPGADPRPAPAPGARQPALALPGRRRGRPVRGRSGRRRVAGAAVRPADRLRPGRHHRHRRHHRHLHGGEPRPAWSSTCGRGGPSSTPSSTCWSRSWGSSRSCRRSSPRSASRRSTSSAPCPTRSAWSARSSGSGTRSASSTWWCCWQGGPSG